jgi:alcohol dehydrogenase
MPGEAPAESFDVAIDCTGSPQGLPDAVRLLRPRGRLVLKTTVAEESALNLSPLVINEITLIGSRCGDMGKAVDFLAQRRFAPSDLISARFGLDRAEEAMGVAREGKSLKVLIDVSR